MFDIYIKTVEHHGEGQTVCYNCALKGLGTGARCWFVIRGLSREFWVKNVLYNGTLIDPESFDGWFSRGEEK